MANASPNQTPKGRPSAPSSPPPPPSDPNDTSTIYFYAPTANPYAFLCQMYHCESTAPRNHRCITFTSAEQYMMYCKALIFNKPDVAKNILKLESPAEQKYLAKSIKASKDEYKEWQKVKYEVVVEGNLAKFGVGLGVTPDEKMSERDRRLLNTGERELVEAAKNDRTRGIGFDEDTADHNREHWGQNLLGRAIMEVREQLRAEERMRQAGEENVEKMEQNG